jgi:hypothetical protein
MSAIIAVGLKKEELLKLPDNKGYINLTLMVDDKQGKFGNNVSVVQEQTKEERDAKAKRNYVGNGKVVYVRGGIKTAKECESDEPQSQGGSSDPW